MKSRRKQKKKKKNIRKVIILKKEHVKQNGPEDPLAFSLTRRRTILDWPAIRCIFVSEYNQLVSPKVYCRLLSTYLYG